MHEGGGGCPFVVPKCPRRSPRRRPPRRASTSLSLNLSLGWGQRELANVSIEYARLCAVRTRACLLRLCPTAGLCKGHASGPSWVPLSSWNARSAASTSPLLRRGARLLWATISQKCTSKGGCIETWEFLTKEPMPCRHTPLLSYVALKLPSQKFSIDVQCLKADFEH